MTYETILQRLARGLPLILDGGVGTEIERQGATMQGDTWCADANLTHREIVRAVHREYLAAGADILTANTFASSALLFSHLDRLNDMERIDTAAIAIAREVAAGSGVLVAGSMSTMRPGVAGSDRTQLQRDWPEPEARALLARKARSLVNAGCDLILMEMMRDTDYSLWACEAAMTSGLPVWIGLSAERANDGALTGFGRPDSALTTVAARLAALQPDAMMIMHTSPDNSSESLDILRKHWRGPIAVYPECGYFRHPHWEFVDIIAPADLVAFSREWRASGASIFGGCCGIGPQHIAALRREYPS